jgi:hypothetical protein
MPLKPWHAHNKLHRPTDAAFLVTFPQGKLLRVHTGQAADRVKHAPGLLLYRGRHSDAEHGVPHRRHRDSGLPNG